MSNSRNEQSELPSLRPTYHPSYGGAGGVPLYNSPGSGKIVSYVRPYPDHVQTTSPTPDQRHQISRLDMLEDRLWNQERTSQNLLERAMRIKEDVIENLNLTHSTWHDEKKQRQLLQDHIRAITDLVRKLDRDIRDLEEQVQYRIGGLSGINSSLKTMEVQQVSALTDIRGRIARCDAAISKLVTDQLSYQSSLKQVTSQSLQGQQHLSDKIQNIEVRLSEAQQKFDRTHTENVLKPQQKDVGDISQYTTIMDIKLRGAVEEMKASAATQKMMEETEREKLMSKIVTLIEKNESDANNRLEKLEKKILESIADIQKAITEVKEESAAVAEQFRNKQQEMEERLTQMIQKRVQQQMDVIGKLKRECREGFETVHESITNSKSVLEGKLELSEEQMKKEMQHIRKMVVLV